MNQRIIKIAIRALSTVLGVALITGLPIIFNVGLLGWRSEKAVGDTEAWIGFFGSYLGLIAAILIAMFQVNHQKKREEQTSKENNRNYVVMDEFFGSLTLDNIATHYNSRIIETPGYLWLLEEKKDDLKGVNCSFTKISHYGTSELIIDCKFKARIFREDNTSHILEFDIGAIEKGVEIFVPLVLVNTRSGEYIQPTDFLFEYKTVGQESLALIQDLVDRFELLILKHKNADKNKIIYKNELKVLNWRFPVKYKSQD